VSFVLLAVALETFGGAERVPRLSERHAKGIPSRRATRLYMLDRAQDEGLDCVGGWSTEEGTAKRPSVSMLKVQAVTLAACRPSTTVRMRASHAPAQESGSAYLLSPCF
jgi:hypothetical protein